MPTDAASTLCPCPQFVDGFKSLVIPSHLRPPAQAINWIALSGDPVVDATMQASPPACTGRVQLVQFTLLHAAGAVGMFLHRAPFCASLVVRSQEQVAGALEAIRDVLAQLRERIEEQGLEAEVRGRLPAAPCCDAAKASLTVLPGQAVGWKQVRHAPRLTCRVIAHRPRPLNTSASPPSFPRPRTWTPTGC